MTKPARVVSNGREARVGSSSATRPRVGQTTSASPHDGREATAGRDQVTCCDRPRQPSTALRR